MRVRNKSRRRRGGVLVETALVLLVFLSFFLGMVDLSIIIVRQHVGSPAARQGARRAAVHGSLAKKDWNGGPWGPTTYGPVAANTADPRAEAILPHLATLDPGQVQVIYTWLDASNEPEKRVRVTVTASTTSLIGYVSGGTFNLTASSTMPVAH